MNREEIARAVKLQCSVFGRYPDTSVTGEGELLIYLPDAHGYRNVIIDDEGDVEYLYVDNRNRADSWHRYFDSPTDEDIVTIASLLCKESTS